MAGLSIFPLFLHILQLYTVNVQFTVKIQLHGKGTATR